MVTSKANTVSRPCAAALKPEPIGMAPVVIVVVTGSAKGDEQFPITVSTPQPLHTEWFARPICRSPNTELLKTLDMQQPWMSRKISKVLPHPSLQLISIAVAFSVCSVAVWLILTELGINRSGKHCICTRVPLFRCTVS